MRVIGIYIMSEGLLTGSGRKRRFDWSPKPDSAIERVKIRKLDISRNQDEVVPHPFWRSSLEYQLSSEAFGVLNKVAKLSSENNMTITESLADGVIDQLANRIREMKTDEVDENSDPFTCSVCLEMYYEPVTLSCGHTFCRECLRLTSACKVCLREIHQSSCFRVNVFMGFMMEKFYPEECLGRSLTARGLKLLQSNSCKEAMVLFSEALQLAPFSHTASNARAKTHILCGDLNAALEDSIQTINLSNKWQEGYLTKGEVLLKLNHTEEAFVNFIMSLALECANKKARIEARKIALQVMQNEFDNHLRNQNSSHFNNKHCHLPATNSHNNYETPSTSNSNHFAPIRSGNRPGSTNQSCSSSHHFGHRSNIGSNCYNATWRLPQISCPNTSDHNEETPLTSANHNNSPCNSGGTEELGRMLNSDTNGILKQYDNACKKLCKDNESFIKPKDHRHIDSAHIHPTDFDCSLCMRLQYEPVCTPCGHTFCRECLERSLDYSTQCPLCKSSIEHTAKNQEISRPSVNLATEAMIMKYLPTEYNDRMRQNYHKINIWKQSIPIFVCTVAFPSVVCPLYIYEPRYRLMLRRVLDHHNNQFGVCTVSTTKPFQGIGTLVQVKDVKYFPDGRAVIKCIGIRRFVTTDYSICDGYYTAKVQFVQDVSTDDEAREKITKLSKLVHRKAKSWYEELPPLLISRINEHYGSFPEKDENAGENGPNWLWWLLAVFPVEEKIKLNLISEVQLKERLVTLYRVLLCLEKKKNTNDSVPSSS